MADDHVYETAGRADYVHRDSGRHVTVSWGAGYPPVKLADHFGGEHPDDFDRQGDDPTAGLITVQQAIDAGILTPKPPA